MSEPIVQFFARRPVAVLRPYIDSYIGYRMEGFPAGIHRGLPGRHLTFIVSLGEPIHVSEVPGFDGSYQAVLSGMHAGPAMISHNGDQVGVAVEVSPLGARHLFGLPAGPLASAVLELPEILGPGFAGLPDRLVSQPDWPRRFDVMDEVLTACLTERPAAQDEVEWAWRRLLATQGRLSVQGLADEVGWSRRHLSERFRQEVGLTPKVAARVVRFERARRSLQAPRRPGLAEVAATCGYFDQSHLTRDFHEFAGCSPTLWMAEEFPSVQDGLVAPVSE